MKKHTFSKLVTVLAVMVALFTAFSVVSFADDEPSASVSSDVTSVARGEEITFTVSVTAENVTSMGILPQYDSNVFEFVEGAWTPEVLSGAALDDFNIDPVPNAILAPTNMTSYDGVVLSFTLRAKADASIADSDVTVRLVINQADASNVTGTSVGVTCAANAHTWNNATCTTAKTCAYCGFVEGTALGHRWTNATCTAPKTCSECSVTEGAALGHNWREATCIKPKTCYTCQATEGGTVDHDFTKKSNEYVAVEGDCENATVYYYSCSVCNQKGNTTYVSPEAPSHKWTAFSCTDPRTCTVCGESDGVPMGHFWQEATCEEPKKCTECNETQGTALGHKYDNGVVTKAPTESAEGEKTFTCSECSGTKVESVAKLPAAPSVENNIPNNNAGASNKKDENNVVIIIVAAVASVGVVGAIIVLLIKKMPETPAAAEVVKAEEAEEAAEPVSEEATEPVSEEATEPVSEEAPEEEEEAPAEEEEAEAEENSEDAESEEK